MDNIERLWSKSAEAGVLGSLMLDNSYIPQVVSILKAESFFDTGHQLIFSAIEQLHGDSKAVDGITLREQLIGAGQLEQVGGVEYIRQVIESVPHASNAEHYAGVVRDKEKYRQLIQAVTQMQDVLDEPLKSDEQIQKVRDIAADCADLGSTGAGDGCYAAKDYNVMAVWDEGQLTFQTEFRDLDRIIGGITPGELVIIAGRPSMGKTSLAVDFTLRAAQAGRSVIFFSLEMTPDSLMQKMCANIGHLNLTEVRRNESAEVREKYLIAAGEFKELPITIYNKAATPEKQIAIVNSQLKHRPVDLMVVDYIQLMNAGRGNENRQQEITTISRKLTRLAKENQVPIILLSQLNRQAEGRTNHRPRLSDLRESGALEQDADLVMLLYREDYYRRNEAPENYDPDGKAEVIIAKNREGPTGVIKMVFIEEQARFGDLFYDE